MNRQLRKVPSLLLEKLKIKGRSASVSEPSTPMEASPTQMDFSVHKPANTTHPSPASSDGAFPPMEVVPEEEELHRQSVPVNASYTEHVQSERSEQPMEEGREPGLLGFQTAPNSNVHPKLVRPLPRPQKNPLLPPSYASDESLNVIAVARQRGEARQFLTSDGVQEIIDRSPPKNEAEAKNFLRDLLSIHPPETNNPKTVHQLLNMAKVNLKVWPQDDAKVSSDDRKLYKQRKMISPCHFSIGRQVYVKFPRVVHKEPNGPSGNHREFSYQGRQSERVSNAVQMDTETIDVLSHHGSDVHSVAMDTESMHSDSDCASNIYDASPRTSNTQPHLDATDDTFRRIGPELDKDIARIALQCAPSQADFRSWYTWLEAYYKGQYNINNLPSSPHLAHAYGFLEALIPAKEAERLAAVTDYKKLLLDSRCQIDLPYLSDLCQELQTDRIFLSVFTNGVEARTVLGSYDWDMYVHSTSLVGHALYSQSMLVVPKAQEDWRFRQHPNFVYDRISFFAGLPLVTPHGHIWGVLWICGEEPRESFTYDLRHYLANAGRDISQIMEQEIFGRRASCDEDDVQRDGQHGHHRQQSDIIHDLVPSALTIHKPTPPPSAGMSNNAERFPDLSPSVPPADLGVPYGKNPYTNNYYSQDLARSLPSSQQFCSDIGSVYYTRSDSWAKVTRMSSMTRLCTSGENGFNENLAHGQGKKDSLGHDLISSNQEAGEDKYAFNGQSESTAKNALPNDHQPAAVVQGSIQPITPTAESGFSSSFLDQASSLCTNASGEHLYDDVYIAKIDADETNPTIRKVTFVGKTFGANFRFANLDILDEGLKQDLVVAWQYDSDHPYYQGYPSGDVVFICSADSGVSPKNRTVGFVAVGMRHISSKPHPRAHELSALNKLRADFLRLLAGTKQRVSRQNASTSASRPANEATLVTAPSQISLRTIPKNVQQRY